MNSSFHTRKKTETNRKEMKNKEKVNKITIFNFIII